MTNRCLAVTGGDNIGKCYRLSEPRWLLVRTIIGLCHTYLPTYLIKLRTIKNTKDFFGLGFGLSKSSGF